MYKQSPYKISNEHLITEDVVKKKFKKNAVNLPPLCRNKVDIKRLTTSRPFTISEGFVGGGAYGKAYKVVNTREMNEKILTSFENSTGKVDKKGRNVFKNSDNRSYVLQDGKKIYVSRIFSPSALEPSLMKNTGKVDKKKRKVFKDSKDRKYVKEGDKKIYIYRAYN
jgi:hypothetical protein